jgi:hypothetical protein
MKCKLLFFVASVILVGVPVSNAQTDSKKIKAQQKAVAPATPLEQSKPEPPLPQPFEPVFWKDDISPTEYLRNEPPKIFEWIQAQIAMVPGKTDQFSTREELRQYEIALNEKMKAIGQIAFIWNCGKRYNVDSQSFEITVPALAIKDTMLKEPNPEALKLRKMLIARFDIKKDTYTAQNAYGASTEVIRTVSDNYVIAYPSGPVFEPSSIIKSGFGASSYQHTFIYYSTLLPMLPTDAREKDKNISCLAVVSFAPPYIFRFKERSAPTRDMPFDSTRNGFAFYGKLDHLWIVNKATGEIYSKHSRGGL